MLRELLPLSSDDRRVSPSAEDIEEYIEGVIELLGNTLPNFGFRGISLNRMPNPKDREFFGSLVDALEGDLGRSVDLGVRYRPKLTSGWTSREQGYMSATWVVQPRYLIRDSKRQGIKKPVILETGDGNSDDFLPIRVLKLLGILKDMPDNLGYIHTINGRYFSKESKAREVMASHNWEHYIDGFT